MTPCLQLISHVPAIKQYGDCTRACVAAMLDMRPEDVPHFADFDIESFDESQYWKRIEDFLKSYGLMWVGVPVQGSPLDVLATMEHNNAGAYYIMGCQGPAGPHHLVCCGDQVVSDPAGYRPLEKYRADDTGLTWVHFLVDRRFLR